MSFNHQSKKTKLRIIALKDYELSNAKDKDFPAFKSGFHRGFNDSLKWVLDMLKMKDIKELKIFAESLDSEQEDRE